MVFFGGKDLKSCHHYQVEGPISIGTSDGECNILGGPISMGSSEWDNRYILQDPIQTEPTAI